MSSLDNGEKPVHAYLPSFPLEPGFQMTAPGGVHIATVRCFAATNSSLSPPIWLCVVPFNAF